jgi:hypothetical protein
LLDLLKLAYLELKEVFHAPKEIFNYLWMRFY